MGLASGVECVGASSATVGGLEPQLQTRMLIVIFVFWRALDGFREGFGTILERFWALKFDFLRSFFENVDFAKIVLPSRRNCYF